jgi:hypothetical protein
MNHRLELVSSHGDDTFAALIYTVCGLASEGEAGAIIERGLAVAEGKTSVSGGLIQALTAAGATGRLVILRRPAQPYLGYATATSAIIDRTAHTVSGNPLAYAAGRNELAWYSESDTESVRRRLETNPTTHSLIVPGGYVVGWLEITTGLVSALNKLEVAAATLGAIDLNFAELAVREALTFSSSFSQGSPEELARALIISTVETTVISALRHLRWQGLALLGYSFNEGGQTVTVQAAAGVDEYHRTLDRLEAQLKAKSLLVGDLGWLAPHAATAIATMRTELAD